MASCLAIALVPDLRHWEPAYARNVVAMVGGARHSREPHKLARIFHHLIKHRCPYDASVFVQEEALHRQRRAKTLRKQAALFCFQLTPLQTN